MTKYKDYKNLEGSYHVIKEKLRSFIDWTDIAFYNWTPKRKAVFCDRMQDVFTKTIEEDKPKKKTNQNKLEFEQICPVCRKNYIGAEWQILCKRCYLKYRKHLPASVVKELAIAGRLDVIDTPEKLDYLKKTGYIKEE